MSDGNGVTIMNNTPKEIAAIAKPAPPAPRLFHLVPKDLNEAMAFAKMVADSDLVPKDYKGKAGNCLIGMQYGAELGLPPLQALQNIAVINGKPGVWGDLGKALLLSKGFKIEERDVKDIKVMPDPEASCKITRPDGQVTIRTFSKADAMTAGIWGVNVHKTYPFRMLAWRAFWLCARDAAADVLKGIWGIEELRDYKTDAVDTTVDAPKEIEAEKPALDGEKAAKEAAPKSGVIETAKKWISDVKKSIESEPTPSNPVVDATPPVPANGLSPDERKHVVALMAKFKVTPEQLKKHLSSKYGITDDKFPTKYVLKEKYVELCDWIENPQDDLDLNV